MYLYAYGPDSHRDRSLPPQTGSKPIIKIPHFASVPRTHHIDLELDNESKSSAEIWNLCLKAESSMRNAIHFCKKMARIYKNTVIDNLAVLVALIACCYLAYCPIALHERGFSGCSMQSQIKARNLTGELKYVPRASMGRHHSKQKQKKARPPPPSPPVLEPEARLHDLLCSHQQLDVSTHG